RRFSRRFQRSRRLQWNRWRFQWFRWGFQRPGWFQWFRCGHQWLRGRFQRFRWRFQRFRRGGLGGWGGGLGGGGALRPLRWPGGLWRRRRPWGGFGRLWGWCWGLCRVWRPWRRQGWWFGRRFWRPGRALTASQRSFPFAWLATAVVASPFPMERYFLKKQCIR